MRCEGCHSDATNTVDAHLYFHDSAFDLSSLPYVRVGFAGNFTIEYDLMEAEVTVASSCGWYPRPKRHAARDDVEDPDDAGNRSHR